jgi:hypothetical protein
LSTAPTDLVAWGALVGSFAPLLISVVQQPQWTGRVRVIVTVLASVVLGFATVAAAGDLTSARDLATSAGTILFASLVSYRNIWKPAGVTGAIESATSPTPGHREL